MLLLLWQTTSGLSAEAWISLGTGAGLIIVGLLAWNGPERSARLTAAKMEGAFGARLTNAESDINALHDEQVRQWQEIGKQGNQLATLEGTMERRQKGRGAGGD